MFHAQGIKYPFLRQLVERLSKALFQHLGKENVTHAGINGLFAGLYHKRNAEDGVHGVLRRDAHLIQPEGGGKARRMGHQHLNGDALFFFRRLREKISHLF